MYHMDPVQPEQSPAYQLQPVKQQKHTVLLASLAIVLAVIIALLASYYVIPQVRTAVDQAATILKLPADLKKANISVGTKAPYSFFTIHGLMFVPATFAPGTRSSSISPSGDAAVFVQGAQAPMIMLGKKDAKPVPVAYGTSPAFLDETHVAYFAKAGIAVRDLSGTAAVLIHPLNASSTAAISAVYSPDRTLVLWTDAAAKQSVLARISPTTYQQLQVFSGLKQPVLTNTYIYDVRVLGSGTQLWRYALDGSTVTQVMTIPASLHVVSIFE